MKYIFFVTTVGSIYEAVLPLIEMKKNKGEIIIIVGTDEAELFFKDFTGFKVTRMKVDPNLINRRTKHKLLSNIIRSKIEFRELFKDVKDAEVYFCGCSFSLVVFSYVKKLSKNNKVFHCGNTTEEKFINYPIEHSFRAFIMNWIAKWLMGVDTVIGNRMGVPIWMLGKNYYKNITQVKDYGDIEKTSNKYIKKLDIIKGKEILIAIGDLLEGGGNYAEPDSFIKATDELIGILEKKFPGLYVIKPHPREKKLYGRMAECKYIIPPHIPSEFILSHPWKIIIGTVSTTLLRASEKQNTTVISIIDLFKWTDVGTREKEMWRKTMIKNTGIHIPKDVNELKDIIIN